MDKNKIVGKFIVWGCVAVFFILWFLFFVIIIKFTDNVEASKKIDLLTWVFVGLGVFAGYLFKKSKYYTPEFAIGMQKVEGDMKKKAENYSPYYIYTGWNLVIVIGIIFFFIVIGIFFGLPDFTK